MIAPNRTRPLSEGHGRLDDQAAGLRLLALGRGSRVQAAIEPVPVVCVCSGKGGVGKTMIAANLAVALAVARRSPVLVDGDLGTPNADLMLGLNPSRRFDPGREDVSVAAIASCVVEAHEGLRLIPGASAPGLVRDPSFQQCRALVAAACGLSPRPGVVVVDAGAGVGRSVAGFAAAAALVVIVATPDPTSVADAYAMMKTLWQVDPSAGRMSPGIVINQANSEEEARATFDRLFACAGRFLGWAPLDLGWVPADENARLSVRRRTPMVIARAETAASRAVFGLAGRVERLVGVSDNRISRFGAPARFLRKVWGGGGFGVAKAR